MRPALAAAPRWSGATGRSSARNAGTRPAAVKARRVTAGIRARLEELEGSELDERSSELQVVLCWLVQGDISLDEDELNAARRRAMFVLAAGGDPHRDVGLDSIAAERLADELDTPQRRARLAAALDELPADDLPAVTAAVESLRADPELAWRSFALSLLADELADE